MKEEKVLQIWEEGNRETIEKLHDILLQTECVYRIIKRRPENLERYFKTHSEQDGFSFDPIRYEWDGKVWILEKLK
jgi:transposase